MIRICTICARGGSKGVPGKNLRPLAGRPLLAHSIEHARQSELFDVIGFSSDSDELLEVAGGAGADVLVRRPEHLATDSAAKVPVIRHCVEEVEAQTGLAADTVVDLDATSPLRTAEDVRAAVRLLEESGVGNVITGAPARRSPYFNLVEVDAEGRVGLSKPPSRNVARRQDAPECFDMNASIYVWQRSVLADSDTLFLADTRLYVMPEERSQDIDTPLDFEIVEFLIRRGEKSQ